MIAYSKIKSDNLLIKEYAKRFRRTGLITEEEMVNTVRENQPAYHRTNIFIRAGVLLLTLILTFCTYGLIVLSLRLDVLEKSFSFVVLFFSLITFAALEYFIRGRNYFASGADDGLLYFALFAFLLALTLYINPQDALGYLMLYIIYFPVLLVSFIRYADRLVAVAGFVAFLLMCFYSVILLGEISKLIMPFVMMSVSFSVYYYVTLLESKFHLRWWTDGLQWIRWASLISFYASGNYYVVRESGISFFNMKLNPGEEIQMYWFFYAFTILIPLLYLMYGLKKKDGMLLNTGLILLVAAAATIRYYHQMLPPETALIMAGLLLIVIGWAAYKYLKTPKHGITFEKDEGADSWFSKDVEAIIIAQALAHHPSAPKKDEMDFGSGKFGGGGAAEGF